MDGRRRPCHDSQGKDKNVVSGTPLYVGNRGMGHDFPRNHSPQFQKTGISNALDGTEDDVVHDEDGDNAEAGDDSDDAATSDVDGSLDSDSD